jgi:branched-chain amino acid transport system ATP-binding protein
MTAVGLSVRGLKKRYGGNWALNGVDLDVEPGELRAVIGPNGAGKSTLFGSIAGEHRPTEGTVTMNGEDITRLPAYRKARKGVVRTFQVTRNFPEMTVRENVEIAVLTGQSQGWQMWRPIPAQVSERAMDRLGDVNMQDLAAVKAGSLSQGDRKRLEIAGALAMDPQVLLLDEPTAGMSPEETHRTTDLIEEVWRREGLTVLLTEHDIQMVFRLAANVTVLHRGRLLCTDTAEAVRERDDVREIYLGTEEE